MAFQTMGMNIRYGMLDASNVKALAAAGSNQAGAAAIKSSVVRVSGASGTNGVRLPKPNKPMQVAVYSSVSANGLLVYPHTGGTINDGTANAAVTIEGRTPALFIYDGTTWEAFFTANT